MTDRRDRFVASVLEDIDSLIGRLDKLHRGLVRKVDCYPILTDSIKRDLRTMKEQVQLAVVPSKD